jgi:hypothetical protein
MKAAACIDCEYVEPVPAAPGLLRCRRYAPRPVPVSDPSLGEMSVWPAVLPEDWCGEYLERVPAGDEG